MKTAATPTPTPTPASPPPDASALFGLVHGGCTLYWLLLLLVLGGTLGLFLRQQLLPATILQGQVEALEANSDTPGYSLLLRTGQDRLSHVPLRHNGFIVHRLSSSLPAGPVSVRLQGGQAVALTLPGGTTVREFRLPPALVLLAAALEAALLLLLAPPAILALLGGWRRREMPAAGGPAGRPGGDE